MAADKEQRSIEIIVQAQQANASIKEMAAGAAVMTAQLSKMSQDDPGRAKLLDDLQQLNTRLTAGRAALRVRAQSAEELAEQERKLAEATREAAEANELTVTTGKKATASLNEMKAAASLMEKELSSLSQDDPGREALQRDFATLSQRIGQATTAMRTHIKTAEELAAEEQQLLAAQEKLNQENIQVVINGKKVAASYNEIKAAADLLEKELKGLPAGTDAFIAKSKELAGVRNRLNDVSEGMGTAAKGTSFLAGGFKSLMATLWPLLALQNVFSFLSQSKEDFESADKAANQMKATLTATGHAAGVTFSEIQKAASELQKKVLIDGDETMGAAALLGTFTKVKKEVFLDSLPLIQDMATKLAGDGPMDLKGATLQVGKALNDPIKGITALSKAGVSFTEQQKEQIKTMVKAGDVAGAQKMILAELKGEFGGAAEAAAKTGGGMKAFSLVMEDVREGVGEKVSKALDTLGGFLGDVFAQAQPVVDVFDAVSDVFSSTWNEIMGLVRGLGLFQSEGSGAKAVVNVLVAVFTVLLAPARLVVGAIGGIVVGIKSMIAAGQALAETGPAAFDAFGRAVRQSLGNVKELLLGIFTFDPARIKAAFANMKAPVAAAVEDFAADFQASYGAKLALLNPKQAEAQAEAAVEAQLRVIENSGAKAAGLTKEQARKLEKAREQAERDGLEASRAIQDLRVALIKDGHTRELVELDLQTARRIEALKGSEEQITQQKLLLEEARKAKVDELFAKWAEEDEAKEAGEKSAQEEINAAADEEYIAYLENKYVNGLMSEQAYQDQLYQIKKQALERELALLESTGKGQTAEAKQLRAGLLRLESAHTKDTIAHKKEVVTAQTAFTHMSQRLNASEVEDLAKAFGEKTVAYKAFIALKKAMALVEIGINLQRELTENSVQAAAFAPPFNIIYMVAANGLSLVRAGMATSKVMAFAKGGNTTQGRDVMDLASLLSGASGGSAAPNGTFAAGGPVDRPTLGLIGEAGAELVIPNWLYSDPKQADLMGFLEAQIASRGGAFAAGGSTGASPVAATVDEGNPMGQMVELMQRFISGQEQFREEVSTWQREFEVGLNLVEVEKGIKVVQQTQSGGGLRKLE